MKTKYEEPRVMRELHEIRAKHYEDTGKKIKCPKKV
jgi:hypothetical protein